MNIAIFETIKTDFDLFVDPITVVSNNQSYTPTIRETYFRVYLSPTSTDQQSYGENRQMSYKGFFDIEVNQPQDINENLLLDSIMERYLKINTLSNIWILNCIRQPSVIEDGRIRTILRVQYETFKGVNE